ncbi:MAG: hypothetical protein COA96_16735 [SAR86 cluster bacterium]|uniref:Uncharacterized protein n=1 Tax=SAR86 cluster bacterium TaxID=2030880 RepID=A0A2A5AHD5_9GAMM|nr:MAG: hypothetical protein COA96_16735 [SAR86 cluster bacterium]
MSGIPKDTAKMQALAGLKRYKDVPVAEGVSVRVYPLRFSIAPDFIGVVIKLMQNMAMMIPIMEVFEDSIEAGIAQLKEKAEVLTNAIQSIDPSVLKDVQAVLNEHVDIELNDPSVTHDIVPPLLIAMIEQTFEDGRLNGWSDVGKQLMEMMPEEETEDKTNVTSAPSTKSLVEAIPADVAAPSD